jgi:S1-C subfamily serine protease
MVRFVGYVCIAVATVSGEAAALLNQRKAETAHGQQNMKDQDTEDAGVIHTMKGLAYVHMQVQRKSYARPWEMAVAELVGLPALILDEWSDAPASLLCRDHGIPDGDLLIVPGGHSTAKPLVKITHPMLIQKVQGKVLKYYPHRLLTLICSTSKLQFPRSNLSFRAGLHQQQEGGTAITIDNDLLPIRSGSGGSLTFNYHEVLKLIKGSGLNSDVLTCARLSPQPSIKLGFFVQSGVVTGYVVEGCMVPLPNLQPTSTGKAPILSLTVILPSQNATQLTQLVQPAQTADLMAQLQGIAGAQITPLMPGSGVLPVATLPQGLQLSSAETNAQQAATSGSDAKASINGAALARTAGAMETSVNDVAEKVVAKAMKDAVQAIADGTVTGEGTAAMKEAVKAVAKGAVEAATEKTDGMRTQAEVIARRVSVDDSTESSTTESSGISASGDVKLTKSDASYAAAATDQLATSMSPVMKLLDTGDSSSAEVSASGADAKSKPAAGSSTDVKDATPGSLLEYALGAGAQMQKVLDGHARSMGMTWRAVENAQMQQFLGLPEGGGGILVGNAAPFGPFGALSGVGISTGSLITKLDGNPIAPSGSLICSNPDTDICPEGEQGRRTLTEYVSKRKEVEVTYKKWADGKLADTETAVTVELQPRDPLLRRYDGEIDGSPFGTELKPSYVLVGGFIFTRATLPMIMDLGDHGPVTILPTLRKRLLEMWKRDKREEIVVLVGSLESEANKFYPAYVMQQLAKINGEKVGSLESVVKIMRNLAQSKPKYVQLEYQHFGASGDTALSGGVANSLVTWNGHNDKHATDKVTKPVPDIVLSHDALHMANLQVLQNYFVPAVISEDLCAAAGFSKEGFENMAKEQQAQMQQGEQPTELPMLGYLDPQSAQWCYVQKRERKQHGLGRDLPIEDPKGASVNDGPNDAAASSSSSSSGVPEAAPFGAGMSQILGNSEAPGSLLELGSTDPLDVYHDLRTHGAGLMAYDDEAVPETAVEAAQKAAEVDATVVSDVTKELLSGLAMKHRSLLETAATVGRRTSEGTVVSAQEATKIPLERVVKIYNTGAKQSFSRPWARSGNVRSTGSGIIIVEQDVVGAKAKELLGSEKGWEDFKWPAEFGDGIVLTNAHVVESGLNFHIQRMDEDIKFPADVLTVGRDVDMAVLRLRPGLEKDAGDGSTFSSRLFEPVKNKEQSTELSVTLTMPALRDKVMVVGFPRSGDAASITEGVVSRVAGFGYVFNLRDDWINRSPPNFVIQVDAAINPGNSGGPVFNADGQFCGLAFASLGGSDGMGYVIPTAVVKSVLPTLLKHAAHAVSGKSVKMVNTPTVPESGFTWRGTENPALRKYLGIAHINGGVLVQSVSPYSAVRGLLDHGDVIIKINDANISAEGEVLIQHEQQAHTNSSGATKMHKDHSLDLRVEFDAIISAHMLHGAVKQAASGGEGVFKDRNGDSKIASKFSDIIHSEQTRLTVLKRNGPDSSDANMRGKEIVIGGDSTIAFKPIPPLAPRYEGVDAFPSWFVTGGLVWTRFTMPLLEEWLGSKQALPCLTTNTALHQWKKHDMHQVIVLVDTLTDPVNMYLDLPKLSILHSINGQLIESMQDLIETVTGLWATPNEHLKIRLRRGIFSDTDQGVPESKATDPTREDDNSEDEMDNVPDAVFKVKDIMDEMPILENYGVPYPAGGWMPGVAAKTADNQCDNHCGTDYEAGHDLLEVYCDSVLNHLMEPKVQDAGWMELMTMKGEDCRQWLHSTTTRMTAEQICKWRAVSDVRLTGDKKAAVNACEAEAAAMQQKVAQQAKEAQKAKEEQEVPEKKVKTEEELEEGPTSEEAMKDEGNTKERQRKPNEVEFANKAAAAAASNVQVEALSTLS